MGLAENVHDAAQGGVADRDLDGSARTLDREAAAQAVGGTRGDGADQSAVAQLLLNLGYQAAVFHDDGVIDVGMPASRSNSMSTTAPMICTIFPLCMTSFLYRRRRRRRFQRFL